MLKFLDIKKFHYVVNLPGFIWLVYNKVLYLYCNQYLIIKTKTNEKFIPRNKVIFITRL